MIILRATSFLKIYKSDTKKTCNITRNLKKSKNAKLNKIP